MRLCEKTLCPLGVDFHRADASEDLPFEDEAFDIVINRHGSFCVSELHRVVKRGGIFITEQVGAENDRALVELLLPGTELPFPEMRLKLVSKRFQKAGFVILQSQEAFRPIKFYDVGAFVWFAHVIAWEFPGFTVEKCLKELYRRRYWNKRDASRDRSIGFCLRQGKREAGLYLPAVVYSCAAHSALRRNGIKTESRLKFRDSPSNGGGYCRFHIIEYSLSPVFCSVCSPEISKLSL